MLIQKEQSQKAENFPRAMCLLSVSHSSIYCVCEDAINDKRSTCTGSIGNVFLKKDMRLHRTHIHEDTSKNRKKYNKDTGGYFKVKEYTYIICNIIINPYFIIQHLLQCR